MREKIADLAHEQWSGWMRHLFRICIQYVDGSFIIPKMLVERWQKQIETHYKDLSEPEKDSDRKEADKFLALFEGWKSPEEVKDKFKMNLRRLNAINEFLEEENRDLKNSYNKLLKVARMDFIDPNALAERTVDGQKQGAFVKCEKCHCNCINGKRRITKLEQTQRNDWVWEDVE